MSRTLQGSGLSCFLVAVTAFFFASNTSTSAFVPPSRHSTSYPCRTTKLFVSPPPIKDEKANVNKADDGDKTFDADDPVELLPSSSITTATTMNGKTTTVQNVEDEKTQDDNLKLGIWTSRALLLLVAAIWGTNFAVRCQNSCRIFHLLEFCRL